MSIEKNIVHHGDNVEVMRSFPDECIDLVVTSPPYDDLREYGGHGWDFEGLADELNRCLKPGGVIVWVVADATINGSETGSSFRQALHFMEIGLRLHDTMIWNKQMFSVPKGDRYHDVFEYMFVISKGAPVVFNEVLRKEKNTSVGKKAAVWVRQKNGETRQHPSIIRREYGRLYNVWETLSVQSNKLRAMHPAQFPEKLAKDHIYSWSNPGDVVLDPFAGSGTTLKAAKELGRDFIGIEIHEPYVNICRERVAQEVLCFE